MTKKRDSHRRKPTSPQRPTVPAKSRPPLRPSGDDRHASLAKMIDRMIHALPENIAAPGDSDVHFTVVVAIELAEPEMGFTSDRELFSALNEDVRQHPEFYSYRLLYYLAWRFASAGFPTEALALCQLAERQMAESIPLRPILFSEEHRPPRKR